MHNNTIHAKHQLFLPHFMVGVEEMDQDGIQLCKSKSSFRNSQSYCENPARLSMGGLGDKFKFPLARCDKICEPFHSGDLAVRNLKLFNEALLGKWVWRFGREGLCGGGWWI